MMMMVVMVMNMTIIKRCWLFLSGIIIIITNAIVIATIQICA